MSALCAVLGWGLLLGGQPGWALLCAVVGGLSVVREEERV